MASGVLNPSAMARFVRTAVIPSLAPPIFQVPSMRWFAFRTVSQIAVNYRRSELSAGKAGKVQGGDRLPWQPEMMQTGLQRDAIYLVRPDGYVAFANAESDEAALETYLSKHNIGVIAQP